ncbi:uncharacterized protein LAJ45_04337 [Morchella importuna]|uniref:uncharacterized protein n=1 Tax=Morchella importuna TaxID=1174673 RepID=UPI001E8D37D7|nr:uncharacterized protein LAJ45_04337 [Morchella importuna]KAH8151715.1 hypothetical protein LAJ45_04337 [Morchella importuna]
MSTQQQQPSQPDPGRTHLRHDLDSSSHQQLPVRPSSNSALASPPSSMQDNHHRHQRRTALEDSNSLRHQHQGPMEYTTTTTHIPPHLPGIESIPSRKRERGNNNMAGMFDQEQQQQQFTRDGRPQPTHHGDSGFTSGDASMFPSPPPEDPRDEAMLGWKFGSSGGSAASGAGDGAESASDWFNTFNRDVGGNNYAQLDDDPPYYLPNNAYKKSAVGSISRYSRLNRMYPNRSSRAEESNSDSFRSVIDDLTIKNQKLKKRLKKLEGLHGGGLAEEKLFEVRMHGLPLHKKQELERLLQGFASTLDSDQSPVSSSKKSPETSLSPSLPSINPSTSSLNIADSAYASNSRSGTTSVAPSSHVKTKSHVARSSSASDKMSGGSVMSSSPLAPPTSERAKMKEVVRKLEQLFTGYKSKNSGSTPESTNSDRSGSNVGNVIPEEVVSQSEPHAIGSDAVTDQRPTRPKDLDPKRLTKAEDNIEYLSNLTHSAVVGTRAEGLGDGWFYLNLIINMAQLHTISVTVPFVKKAIMATSDKLELSMDGKMVRWRGGLEGTRLSSESSSGSGVDSASITSDGSPEDWDGMRKRSPNDSDGNPMSIDPKSKSGSRGRASSSSRRLPALSPQSMSDKFHYKPMFAQSQSFDDDTSSTLSTSMGSYPRGSSDEGGMTSVTKKTTPLDGPIIYYEGGKFCTDLTTQVVRDGKYLTGFPYERFTNNPIGERPTHVPSSPNTKRESPLFSKDTPPSMPSDNDSMNIDSDIDVGLQFSPQFSSCITHTPPPPIELEVSGIGGVLPDDNFAINVQKRHFLLPQNANGALPCSRKKLSKSRILRKISHSIPKSSIDVFQQNENLTESGEESSDEGSEDESNSIVDSGDERSAESDADDSADSDSESSEPAVTKNTRRKLHRHKLMNPELVSAHILRLEPSQLPPASYGCWAPSDETSSVDTDSGADPLSSSSEGSYLRAMLGRASNTNCYSNSGDDEDDLSHDILAANGMKIYRPAVPRTESGEAGSSAATAGDASGYSSPAVVPVNEANMIQPPTMGIMDLGGDDWADSPDSGTSGDQFSSSAGDDEEDGFGMLDDRPTLKRGRCSGTSSSESATGLVRKARKSEKGITLDDDY